MNIIIALWMLGCSGESSPPEPPDPDVVVLIVEGLREDLLEETVSTAHIDRMAARGARFHQAFSVSPWGRPAIASLLTGAFPRGVGIYEERHDRLADDAQLLAEQMTGYHRVGIHADPSVSQSYGFDQGLDVFVGLDWGESLSSAEVVAKASAALDEAPRDTPVYLQLVFTDLLPPWGKKKEKSVYKKRLGQLDTDIGALVAAFEERERPLQVHLVGAHGVFFSPPPGARARLRDYPAHLYDSTTHVPWVVTRDDLHGESIDTLVDTRHFSATVLRGAGRDVLPHTPPPLEALLTGQRMELPEVVIQETDWRWTHRLAIRTPNFRLVRNDDARAWQEFQAHEGRSLPKPLRKALERLPPFELYPAFVTAQGPANSGYERHQEEAGDLAAQLIAWEREAPAIPPLGREEGDVLTLRGGKQLPAVGEGAPPAGVSPVDIAQSAAGD